MSAVCQNGWHGYCYGWHWKNHDWFWRAETRYAVDCDCPCGHGGKDE